MLGGMYEERERGGMFMKVEIIFLYKEILLQ